MNLGTARIVLIVALVAGGVAVLSNAFGGGTAALAPSGGGSGSSPSASSSPSHSRSPATSPSPLPSPNVGGVIFASLNGTYAPGCATKVDHMLVGDHYQEGQAPGDYAPKPFPKTTVYYRIGANAAQNQSDAQYMADTYFNGAKVAKLPTPLGTATVAKTVQVAVVIGDNYVSNC